MRKILWMVLGGFTLTTLAGCQGSLVVLDEYSSPADVPVIDTNNSKYRAVIEKSMNGFELGTTETIDGEKQEFAMNKIGVTSHHLPVAGEFIGDFYSEFLKGYNSDLDNVFVVIGPDHPEKCSELITTGVVKYKTNFGVLESDEKMVKELAKSDYINNEPSCLEDEHSIGVQADYIKYIDDEARIVPIILSSSTSKEQILKLARVLDRFYDQVYFVVSVDFNHYRDVQTAGSYDLVTIKAIEEMMVDDLQIDHVDSPPSLRLGVELAKNGGYETPDIFGYANSYDFTGQYSNTTSYLNVIFR